MPEYRPVRFLEEEYNDVHFEILDGTLEDSRKRFKKGHKIQSHESGLTPLHFIVLSGRKDAPEVIDLLLEHEVQIDDVTKAEEKTALHLVTEYGEFPQAFPVVVKLLEKGADTSIRDRKIRTAYDLALARDNPVLATVVDGSMEVDELKEFYYKKMAEKYGPYLIQSVIDSDADAFKYNLECHADPNLLNQHGAGAIHYSITHCNLPVLDTLQALLDHGADVNLKDHENDTALNLAIKTDKLRKAGVQTKVVALLLKYGADQTVKDLDGRNAYDLANKRGYSDVMSLLKKTHSPQKEDSFIAQKPEPETPRRAPIEHPPARSSSRSPQKPPNNKDHMMKGADKSPPKEEGVTIKEEEKADDSQQGNSIKETNNDEKTDEQEAEKKTEKDKKESGSCVIL